jgi:DNA invertase Pin-like site-specific DNA recombinase
MSAKRLCAIYTRTSTEEGLSQDFNSLLAQAEACAGYIRSHAGDGWQPLKAIYEDGGYSGGSMDRAGLSALMADIAAKRIDVVVVYKVDRLTRSLADFAKMVEIMDAAQVSFVSVTLAFNTTTSMGRLTLNVLLSFAQFEREVTGERIRDKVAASKAKGMWMGGMPPLGYDIHNRALVVNQAEAETIRFIFRRFLEMGSVHALKTDLDSKGLTSKRWTTARGEQRGGFPFSRGALYDLLGNVTYRGEVAHKGKTFAGLHERIIDDALWNEVQALRNRNAKLPHRLASNAKLIGKLHDDRGNAMAPTSTHKRGTRYRYYVSTALTCGRPEAAGSVRRVPLKGIEDAVVAEIVPLLAPAWRAEQSDADRALAALQKVVVSARELTLELRPEAIVPGAAPATSDAEERVLVSRPISFAKPRNSTALIASGPRREAARVDRALIRALARAHAWTKLLEAGTVRSVAALAKQEKLCPIYTRSILPLAFLAPDLTTQILEGRQPRTLTLTALLAEPLPLDWPGQRARFGAFI